MTPNPGSWRPGAIVWRELATTDLERASAFYAALLGWTWHDGEGPGPVYRHFEVGGVPVAGGHEHVPPGAPSHWLHYVSVPDVDAATATATAAGATVRMGPLDIPKVGRAAYLSDPQGATVALFRDSNGDAPASTPPYPLGAFCWESLLSTDRAGSVAFYAAVAGLGAADFHGNIVLERGPHDGVADVGPAPHGAPSAWVSHVVVGDLDAATARAVELGGEAVTGEIRVPEVGRMTFVRDPTGAVLSLYEPLPRG